MTKWAFLVLAAAMLQAPFSYAAFAEKDLFTVWEAKAKQYYEVQEEGLRAAIDEKIRKGVEAAKAEGRNLDGDGQKLALQVVRSVEYQYLIDRMFCVELSAKSTSGFDLPAFQKCAETRVAASEEYFRFASYYGDQFPKEWNACGAKTCLLGLEARYPPFPFMRSIGQDFHAYDSVSLLACVKERI